LTRTVSIETSAYLRRIDTRATGRKDVTPLFADVTAFDALIDDLAGLHHDVPITNVARQDGYSVSWSTRREIATS
jgi:hypothetical protein